MDNGRSQLNPPRGKTVAVIATVALAASGLLAVKRLTFGSPRLISIQQVPDVAESCYRVSDDFPKASRTDNLFVAFDAPSVHAQDNNGPIDLLRPPVRDIRDTGPIFSSVGVDPVRNEVFLQDSNRWSIRVRQESGGNTPPVRALEGQKTLISRTMHGFMYDPLHDEIVVTSPLAQAVVTFRGGASGEEAPIRVIQGPRTNIQGTAYGANAIVTVDPVNNEIYVPAVPNVMLVFDRTANGDVGPKRVLRGGPIDISGQTGVYVDPVHNLLLINGRGAMYIFNRTAAGDDPPKAVIRGSKSHMANAHEFAVTGKGWLIAAGGDFAGGTGFVGAWSMNDNGDVAPRWKLPVQQLTGYVPYSIIVDPVHEEMMMAAAGRSNKIRPSNGIMNTVITFSWPEIF